jgi:hypothetical protein
LIVPRSTPSRLSNMPIDVPTHLAGMTIFHKQADYTTRQAAQ